MLDLTAILAILNASIDNWTCGKKQLLQVAQLCKRISQGEKEQVWPAEFSESGEGTYAGVDEDYDLIIYHRAIGMQVSAATTGRFGSEVGDTKNSLQMCMVVYSNRKAQKLSKEELAMKIQAGFPDQLTGKSKPKNIKTLNINITGFVLNEEQVFNEEYKNVDYFLRPENILIKVNYTIESTFSKRCFKTC
jgi:hypothetical protein